MAYTGTLPVGTDTLCYWWDGTQNRWRDPVPGKVVDAGGGVKALQATRDPLLGLRPRGAWDGGPARQRRQPNPRCSTRVWAWRRPASTAARSTSPPAQFPRCMPLPTVSAVGFPVALDAALRAAATTLRPSQLASPSPSPRQTARAGELAVGLPGQGLHRRRVRRRGPPGTHATAWATVWRPGSYAFTAWSRPSTTTAAQQPSLSRQPPRWMCAAATSSPFGFNWLSSYDTLLIDRSAPGSRSFRATAST